MTQNQLRNPEIFREIQQISHPLRVAVYCRVSTARDTQDGSFETQLRHFTGLARREGLTLMGIYGDQGKSGRSALGRPEFLRMLADCEKGKIDLILTKSISRFARNTLDCLQTVRELQGMGVDILFEKENIDTRSPYSEMLLTILAAFAQEESRNLSENVKWSIRSRYREQICRWSRLYGYTSDGVNHFLIVPEEAAVIRYIFARYERGDAVRDIIRELEEKGVPTPGGMKKWYDATIYDLFDNEKYVGDLRLQKLYTVDHITHRQVKNDGTVPSYYIEGHHEPIVSRQTRRRVLAVREMRRQNGQSGPRTYPFGRMLKCPVCGGVLVRQRCGVGKRGPVWCCEISHFALWEEALFRAALEACHEGKRSEIERVDYWWLEEWVAEIRLSMQSLTLFWKDGGETTAAFQTDDPRELGRRHMEFRSR